MQVKCLDQLVQQLSNDKKCKLCGKDGQVIHHIIHRNNMAVRYCLDNLMVLCSKCHMAHHSGIHIIKPSDELRQKANKVIKLLDYEKVKAYLSTGLK